jgi:hypothetical protein
MRVEPWVAGLCLLALVASLPAAADTCIERASHRDAFTMMGQTQPASDDTVTLWLGADRVAMSGGSTNAIVRLDQSRLYLLDRKAKTYHVLALPIDLAKILDPNDPNAQMVQQMLEMMKSTASVTPTDSTQKIGTWNARLYHAVIRNSMMTFKSEIWATTDVKITYPSYRALDEALLSLNPATKDAAAEFRKIEGLPVLEEQTVAVMGSEMKMWEKTLAVRDGAAPAGTYDPPSGYTEKPFNLMEAMQRQ